MATNEADTLFQLARRVRVLERAAAGAPPLNEPMLAAASRILTVEGASVPSVFEMRQHLQQELGWRPSVAETRRVLAAIASGHAEE
jgi:hypothetical protein